MTVPKAILLLRERADLSQADLAKRIGTTSFTVSRWETERRAPSSRFFERLAALAGENRLPDLRDFFDGQRKSIIAARMKNLQSPGTQRRVSAEELEAWFNLCERTRGVAKDNIRFFAFIARELEGELGDALLRKVGEMIGLNTALRDAMTTAISSIEPYMEKRKGTHGKAK
jgi:transcriptional regulator with XRE-family HTH domain